MRKEDYKAQAVEKIGIKFKKKVATVVGIMMDWKAYASIGWPRRVTTHDDQPTFPIRIWPMI